jgi:hypothetical protein
MTLPDPNGALILSILEMLQKARVHRTCVTCTHFDEARETCGKAEPPARPPARVIASGCPAYDEVPPF